MQRHIGETGKARRISRCVAAGLQRGNASRNIFCDELVQQRGVPEKLVYQAIADFLAVEFAEEVHPSRIFVSGEEKPSLFIDVGQITVLGSDGETCLYIAPTENRIKTLLDHLGRSPRLKSESASARRVFSSRSCVRGIRKS